MKLIARVVINDVALVPWSATEVGTGRSNAGRKFRFVTRNDKFVTMKEVVARFAKVTMGPKKAYGDGPVFFDLKLVKKTDKEALWGRWCYAPIGGASNIRGDLTNLIKSIEDALQKVVFVDDRLICAGRQMIVWGKIDQIIARAYILEELEEDSFCHPIP